MVVGEVMIYLIINTTIPIAVSFYLLRLALKEKRRQEEAERATSAALVFDEGSTEEAGGGCSICLREYENGERRATVPACSHRYHAVCIQAWAKQHNSCPLCRHEII